MNKGKKKCEQIGLVFMSPSLNRMSLAALDSLDAALSDLLQPLSRQGDAPSRPADAGAH